VRVGLAYLRSLAKLWKHPQIAKLHVQVNQRLTSSVARCVASRDIIELSPAAATRSRRLQREMICHEAAHQVAWERYGRVARPHGPEWRSLVKAAGFEPKATLVRCGERRRRATNTATFLHICPVCQFSKRAKRRVAQWRCPECRAVGLEGSLRIEQVPVR
jgi:predicted SprT family Zn-dependent metalloprotease